MTRPIDHKKKEAILGAAAAMFLVSGYSATSIEGIAKAAGVSKVTIYRHFRCKRRLFNEAVRHECDRLRVELHWGWGSKSLHKELVSFGIAMNEFFGRSELVRLERLVAAEIEENPDLGCTFLDAVPRPAHFQLYQLLARAEAEGLIEIAGSEFAAEQLAAMFLGVGDLERRFGQGADIDEVATRVEAAVSLFLVVYGCSGGAVQAAQLQGIDETRARLPVYP